MHGSLSPSLRANRLSFSLCLFSLPFSPTTLKLLPTNQQTPTERDIPTRLLGKLNARRCLRNAVLFNKLPLPTNCRDYSASNAPHVRGPNVKTWGARGGSIKPRKKKTSAARFLLPSSQLVLPLIRQVCSTPVKLGGSLHCLIRTVFLMR